MTELDCLKWSSVSYAIHLTISTDTAITSSWFTHKYAAMNNWWGILCQKIHYLSWLEFSTPLLGIWSFSAGLLSIPPRRNMRGERIMQHIKVFRSRPHLPLFLHFGVFFSPSPHSTEHTHTQNTHMHTSAPSAPPPPLCLCMRPPRSIPIVMLITCLLCFAGAHHPSKRLPAFHLTQCIPTCN